MWSTCKQKNTVKAPKLAFFDTISFATFAALSAVLVAPPMKLPLSRKQSRQLPRLLFGLNNWFPSDDWKSKKKKKNLIS